VSFLAVNSKNPKAEPILPPDASFLKALRADNVVGPAELADEEKKMLLVALRFYFGPAQWWDAVGTDQGMGPLRFYFRLDLLPDRFSQAALTAPDQAKLHAIRLPNEGKPSYFLYESTRNLMLYIGPEAQTGAEPKSTVINALVLDWQHRPLSSHTLWFWFETTPMELPESFQDKLLTDSVVGELYSIETDMLVSALRFYFGPAQFLQRAGLDKEPQTGTGEGQAGDVELHAAITRTNAGRLPSYQLEETHYQKRFYVGPDFSAGGPSVKVITAAPFDDPQSVHPLKFKFIDDAGKRGVSTGLPELRVDDIAGDHLDSGEKEMLLGALGFYFGPAQSKHLQAVAQEKNLGRLQFYFGSCQWEWWRAVLKVLEKDLNLDAPDSGEVKLRATKRDNPKGKASYFLYASGGGALQKLLLYVGPDFEHGRSSITVINTLVLDNQLVPQSSHTLDFGFLDLGPHEVSARLDGSFLSELQAVDAVGSQDPTDPEKNLTDDEKEMLLGALRFYFGPATNFWGAVTKDALTAGNLNDLNTDLRKPGERYEILELQTGLGLGYFASTHQVPDQVKLFAAKVTPKDDNPDRLPKYFLYEARSNLTFYVGPDFLHGRPTVKVINTLVLDERHVALSSHTLDFGFEP
jgi:hypothetical protein